MSIEDTVESLKVLNFKLINSECSKHNLNMRIDEYAQRKFGTALRTIHLLASQPIEIAISSQTKIDTVNAIKDVKKVLDSLYLATKNQEYKDNIDKLNEIISNRKMR